MQGARTRRYKRQISLLFRELRPITREADLEIEREQPLPFEDFQKDEHRAADLVVSCDDSRGTTDMDLAVRIPRLVAICRERESAVVLPLPVCVDLKRGSTRGHCLPPRLVLRLLHTAG